MFFDDILYFFVFHRQIFAPCFQFDQNLKTAYMYSHMIHEHIPSLVSQYFSHDRFAPAQVHYKQPYILTVQNPDELS